jgi:uncharacterized protein
VAVRVLQVQNVTRNRDLGDRIRWANTRWLRLRGMLGRPEPQPGEGLLIEPCRGVHMFWMKYPLDIVFLDKEGRAVALYGELQPWARSRTHRAARYALELPAGTIESTGIQEGDQFTWTEVR